MPASLFAEKEKKLLEKKLNVSKGEKHDSPWCFLAPVGKRSREDVGRTNLRTTSYSTGKTNRWKLLWQGGGGGGGRREKIFSPFPVSSPSPI